MLVGAVVEEERNVKNCSFSFLFSFGSCAPELRTPLTASRRCATMRA